MQYFYMRPYPDDPDCAVQQAEADQIDVTRRVIESHDSAKRRTELEQMLKALEPGDEVVVTHLYVLADSTRHLIELLEQMEETGASLWSLREQIRTKESASLNFLETARHLVQLQSDVISMSTRAGLTKAKEQGKQTGRPRKPDENVRRAIAMYQSKNHSLADIREQTGISKSTLYRYLESETID
ncbi:recombinase family protein [Exiguobacterium sp. TDN 0502]|uniref:recombinase family protein n=1 Tax=Exiguobacterium sp. TDN 0502 TaxID=3420731 RepID=UPI003D77ED99